MTERKYHIEATPQGVSIARRNAAGQYEHTETIGFHDMVKQLDAGRFDKDLVLGARTLAVLMDAQDAGLFNPTDEQRLIYWRWMVSFLFITEQAAANGTVDVLNDNGGTDKGVIYSGACGGMTIYPAPERFALANHVEALAIERYGIEEGRKMSIQFYQLMTDASTGPLRLSDMGREGFAMLHDGFIQQLQTEGMPSAPTQH